MKSRGQIGPLETLREILAMWPKCNEADEDDEKLRQYLSDYLTDDFDRLSFGTRARGEFSVFSKELIIENETKILVWDTAEPEYDNLATLVKGSDGIWRLKSFLSQCLSCFGAGVIGKELCDVCGGSGWGLAKWPNDS